MRILISAIACHPKSGSEAFVGWNAVQAISRHHDLVVLTHSMNREALEQEVAEGRVPANVRFVFLGISRPWLRNRLLARLQSWARYVFWNAELLRVAQSLHEEYRFELAHHITYASWRVGSPLWKLGIPLVWGPIGGVGKTPLPVYLSFSATGIGFELLRAIMQPVSRLLGARECARRASMVLASNEETREAIRRIRGDVGRCDRLSAAFFTEKDMVRFSSPARPRENHSPLRLFAGGNLIASKGVAIALSALAIVRDRGVKFQYTIGGGGPEIAHLRRLCNKLDLEMQVTFRDDLRGEEYVQVLQSSHIFLLPSFRENAPITLLEAMLAGCAPVVADASAQGEIVRAAGGCVVPVTTPRTMAKKMAETIIMLEQDRIRLAGIGHAAQAYVKCTYSQSHYVKTIEEAYMQAMKSARGADLA